MHGAALRAGYCMGFYCPIKHCYQKADATIIYLGCVSHIKTMMENNETNHRDGKNKKSLLPLFGCIRKEQAEQVYKDLEELKSLEAKRCAFLSESSLKKEWLRAEEDKAWQEQ